MLYTERIRALREDKDLNQTAVAKAIHVAQTTYSDYEKGKKEPGVLIAKRLADALDITLDTLCGDNIRHKSNNLPLDIIKVLEQLKAQVHVDGDTVSFTISKDNDCSEYSSFGILSFFKEYEIIQTFANSIATPEMIKTLESNLIKKYKHIPKMLPYENIP